MILDLPNLQQICNTPLTLVVHSCDNLGRGICNSYGLVPRNSAVSPIGSCCTFCNCYNSDHVLRVGRSTRIRTENVGARNGTNRPRWKWCVVERVERVERERVRPRSTKSETLTLNGRTGRTRARSTTIDQVNQNKYI